MVCIRLGFANDPPVRMMAGAGMCVNSGLPDIYPKYNHQAVNRAAYEVKI